MIVFLFICAVSLWAGIGVLTALGLKLDRTQVWLLAPGACLVCWAIALGIGVSLGVPVRRLALPIWAVTAVVSALGAWRSRGTMTREVAAPLLVAVALPAGVMVFDFWQGLPNYVGGPSQDGWSYVAFGQYLWEKTKGAQGHLAPLYQYAFHLNRTRVIAPALLGFMSPLTGDAGDTQAAAGYFVAWSLFIFGASCACVAVAAGVRQAWLVVFCAVAVASRWVFGAIEIHNYDNLIAISFLPLTMGIVSGLPRPDWRGAVALGGVVAAAVYTYPEMAAFVALGGALAIARRMSTGAEKGAWIAVAVGGGGVATFVLLPASSDLLWFISNQLTAATAVTGGRAGEGAFSELLMLRDWGASVWGFTSSAAELRAGAGWQFVRQTLGLMMWALTCAGLVRAVRRRQWDIAAMAIVLIGGALYMVAREKYSYGAYKFVLLGWWSLAWLAVTGAQGLVRRSTVSIAGFSARTFHLAVASAVALIGTAFLGSVAGRVVMFSRNQPAASVQPYRSVLDVERVAGSEPIAVAVNDDRANEWAVYFLRRHSILLLGYRGYMGLPHVIPLMEQAAPVDIRAVRYVLTDEEPGEHEVVWARGPYLLWRIPPAGAAFVRNVANPNGLERMNGRPFFWIGHGDTELDIVATSAGEATLSGRFVLGPSLPDRGIGRVLIGSSTGAEQTLSVTQEGLQSISLTVRAGSNHVYMRSLDRPSVAVTSSGNSRPLLLGIEGLSVSLGPTHAADPSARRGLP